MTIHLPDDLERSIKAVVHEGRFATADEVIAAAARLLLRELDRPQGTTPASDAEDTGLGSIGAMRDSADELDEIVADAYRKRPGGRG